MAWGDKTQIMTAQAVQGTELFSSYVALSPGEVAHVQVKADTNGTTDDLEVRIYGTLDATSETPDNQSNVVGLILKGNDPAYWSTLVSGFYKFRIGVVRSGSTDTITTDMWVRKDGVALGEA